MINFHTPEQAETLAQAILNTIPDPFLVLDDRFNVLAASKSFYRVFDVSPDQTLGCLLFALGDGQWDIGGLRLLLQTIIPQQTAMDGFEVEHDFPMIGRKTRRFKGGHILCPSGSRAASPTPVEMKGIEPIFVPPDLLTAQGLLRSVGPQAPDTVGRRLATWSTLTKWRGLKASLLRLP